MKRAATIGISVLCAAVLAACGSQGKGATNPFTNSEVSRPQPTNVRGCLTASGDRYVLTELPDASAGGNSTTQAYQLTKTADQPLDLKQYVGQVVDVAGEAAAAQVAEVRETDPASPAATTGAKPPSTADGGPKVGTVEDTRLAVRQLSVSSVTPTGDRCGAAGSAPAAR